MKRHLLLVDTGLGVLLGLLTIIIVPAIIQTSFAQVPPQQMMLDVGYYQQRIAETDARAAALSYEVTRLTQEVERLRRQLVEATRKPEEKK